MNLLDIIIIAMMIFFMLRGLLRGFFREIASLAGVLLGLWLANLFQPEMTKYLGGYLPRTDYLPVISFIVIFAVVLIACNLLGWMSSLMFRKASHGFTGRTLGAGVAVIKGVVITYLVIVLLTLVVPAKTPLITRSRLAPWIILSYQSMIRVISPDQYEKWKKRLLGNQKEMGEIMSGKIEGSAEEDGKE